MGINEILQKNNPIQKKIDRENRSDFAKLVDRNTELVDENKWLKADNEILKGRIDKAVEYIKEHSCELETILGSDDWQIRIVNELLEILKGEDKE